MSLSQLAKSYESTKRLREKTSQTLRNQIEQRIEQVTISALKFQNHKVNQIHKNQQAIESKLKKQQELVAQFRNNQEIWVSMYEQLNRSLMLAGDLAHYAGYVQAELGELVGQGSVAAYLEQSQREQLPEAPGKKEAEVEREKEDNQVKQAIVEEPVESESKVEQDSGQIVNEEKVSEEKGHEEI